MSWALDTGYANRTEKLQITNDGRTDIPFGIGSFIICIIYSANNFPGKEILNRILANDMIYYSRRFFKKGEIE